MSTEVSVVRKIVGAVIASLVCGALGVFILWNFRTTFGLCLGSFFILMMLCIALPTPLHLGLVVFKDNTAMIGPAIGELVRMGRRKTDPVVEVPAEPAVPVQPLGANVETRGDIPEGEG